MAGAWPPACPDIASCRMLSDELLQLGPKIGNLSSYVVLNSVKLFTGVALDDPVTRHFLAPAEGGGEVPSEARRRGGHQ